MPRGAAPCSTRRRRDVGRRATVCGVRHDGSCSMKVRLRAVSVRRRLRRCVDDSARQPPRCVMSSAPSSACASQRKPCTLLPSASSRRADAQRRRDQRDEGAECASGISQTSTAIAAPPCARRAPARAWAARCRAGIQAVVRRGRASPRRSVRAALGQLAVERHARQVRADDGDLHASAAAPSRRSGSRRRQRRTGRAQRQPGRVRGSAGRARPAASRCRSGRSSVTPNGRPSSAQRCRHRERRIVEQVDEVGVRRPGCG